MTDLFDPPGIDSHKLDLADRFSDYYRIPLSSAPYQWLSRGYSKEHGFTKFVYSYEPSPRMVPVAGHKDTSNYLLIDVSRMVALAARCTDPHVRLDWAWVADWLEAGGRPEIICTAIGAQIRRMGDSYDGVRSLKLFDKSVRAAIERDRAARAA